MMGSISPRDVKFAGRTVVRLSSDERLVMRALLFVTFFSMATLHLAIATFFFFFFLGLFILYTKPKPNNIPLNTVKANAIP
jgi:hypothetical protein